MDYLPDACAAAYRRRRRPPYASPDARRRDARRGSARRCGVARDGTPLRRELLAETFDTSLPELLRYADRSSMAHSREVRLPFLDRRMAEFALSLPAAFLYARRRDQARSCATRCAALVPDAVLDAARQGRLRAAAGAAGCMSRRLRERIAEVLLDPRRARRGLYDRAAIEADVAAGRWRDPDGIWRALNVELWLGHSWARRPHLPK